MALTVSFVRLTTDTKMEQAKGFSKNTTLVLMVVVKSLATAYFYKHMHKIQCLCCLCFTF